MSTQSAAPSRRRMIVRRRRVVAVVLVLLLAVAGYVAACAFAPLPTPTFTPAQTGPAEREVVADTTIVESVVSQQTLPTAVGWAESDTVWSNDDEAYPLGSVSKLITVLVAMEAQPLAPGADGETYVWTQADRDRQDYYLSLDGVAYPIAVGTEITQRQMLQFIFLPSSNDYAYAYAMMVFGDNDTFLAAVEAFAEKYGLTSLSFVEPTGMDDGNRASAADLVRIARVALANETVREFNAMQSAEMPWGIGLIENTNPLLGEVPGIIGVKTGMLSTVGYNFIAAQTADAHGREVIKISVTLARESKEARADSGAEVLAALDAAPLPVSLVGDAEVVGTVHSAWGDEVTLQTSGTASTVLLPGERATVKRELQLGEIDTPGTIVGSYLAATPTGEIEVPVVSTGELTTPDMWWRITHPAILFGWG